MKKLSELVLEKVVNNDSVLRTLTPVDEGAEVGHVEKNVHCFARIVLQVLGLGWDWSLIVDNMIFIVGVSPNRNS